MMWVPLFLLALVHLICARPNECSQQISSGLNIIDYSYCTMSRLSQWLDQKLAEHADTVPDPVADPALENKRPEQPPIKKALKSSVRFLRITNATPSSDFRNTNLEWKAWNGWLPDEAVSIYNSYSKRVDYICKVKCHSGYYDSTSGDEACAYTADGYGYTSTQFDVLVNKDNFEILDWKEGADGSVTPDSIKTCDNDDIYVGKNEYGLGEVKVSEKVFNLPWGGSRYWYRTYMVLELHKDVKKEHLMDVKYQTSGITPIEYPPEVLNKGTVFNYNCQPMKVTRTLSKTITSAKKWEINFSVTAGVGTTIETGIPFIVNGQISFRAAFTYKLTKSNTYTESSTYSLTLDTEVPIGHSCTIEMRGKKYALNIPYTARLKRSYSNGETTWTTVTGTYNSVQISEVEADMERCEPLPDAKPC
ncbi:natterin-3-like [Corythoichthys intestinalis]|uniref:natterin-3-like n=1 Tax=Corythoichthys intestinalis TaxID=161448 RepID=UPI0025A5B975|nr:natterin-3-like [Corythoichthys intestinalis]XP_057688317.1 natterin-3-like [Corythoichthys intestinalis]XP_057688318.1 natterin-3-like [Corythoichthys intestinalis]XP_057688319.1 natterin-3-like [Corythoichthys intestinalis]XP_057688320.1 natterin-3-like [Corythoichthys intestinalis]XP_061804504.1 natterin-3-like [Nerophis lumbriciformis]